MVGTAFTEQQIKRALDGTFTRIVCMGDVKTIKVKPDHIPTHSAVSRSHYATAPQGIPKGETKLRGARWTDDEDRVVIEMIKDHYTQAGIAYRLGRGLGTISNHIHLLRKAGRL